MSETVRSDLLHHLRIITQKELRALVPYTPQHILRLEKAGKFPRRLRLGQNRIGWRLKDVEDWLLARTPAETYRADPPICDSAQFG
jgi:prophage regulatory protein